MATTPEQTLLDFHSTKVATLLEAAAQCTTGTAAEADVDDGPTTAKGASADAGTSSSGGAGIMAHAIVCFETIPATAEAVLLATFMAATHPAVPFWISLQCSGVDTVADQSLLATACTSIVKAAAGGRLIGVGANCFSPALAPELMANIRAALPAAFDVLCYPNRGESWDAQHKEWHATEDSVAVDTNVGVLAKQWVDAGATVIGGCCRVGSAEIAAMKAAVVQPNT